MCATSHTATALNCSRYAIYALHGNMHTDTNTTTTPSYKMLLIFIVFAFYLQTSKSTNEKRVFFLLNCCLHSLSLSNRSDKSNTIVERTCAHKCNRLMLKLYRSEQNKLQKIRNFELISIELKMQSNDRFWCLFLFFCYLTRWNWCLNDSLCA